MGALDIISTTQAKNYMKVDLDVIDDDAIIESLIKLVFDIAQKQTQKRFFPITVDGIDYPADYSELPEGLRMALLDNVALRYENRGQAFIQGMNDKFFKDLSPYYKTAFAIR